MQLLCRITLVNTSDTGKLNEKKQQQQTTQTLSKEKLGKSSTDQNA